MADNYYDILGVSKDATGEEIKKAYRKKAMESHPDRHGGDKEKEAQFKKINEAYGVLSDTGKKAHYDRFGSTEGMGGFGGGQGGFNVDFDIGDIFESFFGQGFGGNTGGRKKKNENGEDIEINVKLDFGESILGVKKTINFDRKEVCSDCAGSGAKKGTTPKTCITCHGTGQVRKRVNSFFGVIEQASACPTCHGSGVIIEEKCGKCNGNKRIVEKIKKEIDVPAGIDNEMTLKIKGEGNKGTNGRNGDLYVIFSVPDSFDGLVRENSNLFYDLILDPVEAVLGIKKKVKLPLLGERTIEIKIGIQDGEIIKFKGDGVKDVGRDIKGDLFIKVKIKIPTNPTKKEKELYEQIAEIKGIETNKGIFGKIF
ncbi:DnaJ domain-containing protein [Candidatus Gracilibacteria bacterium]|nr:DnaJ domain-containing protein [Candidatus Gracilibacteria bacterium]